jgi:hypothetical protein
LKWTPRIRASIPNMGLSDCNFPHEIDVRCETLDRTTGVDLAVFASPRMFSWQELKQHFEIDDVRASECEEQLLQGTSTLIASPREWEGDWNPKITRTRRFITRDEWEAMKEQGDLRK